MIGNNIPSTEEEDQKVPRLKGLPKSLTSKNSYRAKYSPINASISLSKVSPRGNVTETIKTIDEHEYEEGLSAYDDDNSPTHPSKKESSAQKDQMLFVDLGSPLGGISDNVTNPTPEKTIKM